MRLAIMVTLLVLAASQALGGSSPNYEVSEYVLNLGGHPRDAEIPQSAKYRVTLASIGDPAHCLGTPLPSSNYQANPCFVSSFLPPGELTGLHLTDADTLVWDPEPSVGVYNLYRGDPLPDPSWSTTSRTWGDRLKCGIDPWLVGESWTDTTQPATGDGLVTAMNRLAEEGPIGSTHGLSGGDEPRQPNLPCP